MNSSWRNANRALFIRLAEAKRRRRVQAYIEAWKENEQLYRITGGVPVEEFVAARQREFVAELAAIREQIAAWLATCPPPTPTRWQRLRAFVRSAFRSLREVR